MLLGPCGWQVLPPEHASTYSNARAHAGQLRRPGGGPGGYRKHRLCNQPRPDQPPGSVTQHCVISDYFLYPSGLFLPERRACFFCVMVLGEHSGVCGGTVGMNTHDVLLAAALPSPSQVGGEKPTRPHPTMVTGGCCHSRG